MNQNLSVFLYRVKKLREKLERSNWKKPEDSLLYKRDVSCELPAWAFVVEHSLTTAVSAGLITMPKFHSKSSQLLDFTTQQKNSLILSHRISIDSVNNNWRVSYAQSRKIENVRRTRTDSSSGKRMKCHRLCYKETNRLRNVQSLFSQSHRFLIEILSK